MENAKNNTHPYTERQISLAKTFMYLYLNEQKSINHFNAEILGMNKFDLTIKHFDEVWAQTPFCWALRILIEERRVKSRQDETGLWWYLACT